MGSSGRTFIPDSYLSVVPGDSNATAHAYEGHDDITLLTLERAAAGMQKSCGSGAPRRRRMRSRRRCSSRPAASAGELLPSLLTFCCMQRCHLKQKHVCLATQHCEQCAGGQACMQGGLTILWHVWQAAATMVPFIVGG